MALVVPTILASTVEDYEARLRRVRPFARRIHIDVTDGKFSDSMTVGLDTVHGIPGIPFDIHLMFERPQDCLDRLVELAPRLVIFHAEADCDHRALVIALHERGIRAGLAILPETAVSDLAELLPDFDEVMIFTGTLGENRGHFRPECLTKIAEVRKVKPDIEVGVDGGIDLTNAAMIVRAGADVLYVGGAIHHAPHPAIAYEALTAIATGE